MTSPALQHPCSNDFPARCEPVHRRRALTQGPANPRKGWPFCASRAICTATSTLLGWGSKLITGIAAVFRADESQYLPQVVGVFDDGAERRHRADGVFVALARIHLFWQFVAPQGAEPKQGVIIAVVDPGIVGERWAH